VRLITYRELMLRTRSSRQAGQISGGQPSREAGNLHEPSDSIWKWATLLGRVRRPDPGLIFKNSIRLQRGALEERRCWEPGSTSLRRAGAGLAACRLARTL